MDNQGHGKNHAPEHESQGVYVCHKCGWPFPNSHPSARHRRSHKKICGAIEGYKLVISEGSAHSTVSDDEHLSDEDCRTSSTKYLKRCSNEGGSGGVGERSNRSEDEVFSDAVAEFQDSGIEEHLHNVKEPANAVEPISENRTTSSQLEKDGAVTVLYQPTCNSDGSCQMQNTEFPGRNLSGSAQRSQDHVLRANIGLMMSSLMDCGTEESIIEPSDDNLLSACDLNPIKLETQPDVSQESRKNAAGEFVTETDAEGNEGTNLDRHPFDNVVSPSDNTGKASEVVSKLGKTEAIISDPAPAEEHSDELVSKLSLTNLSPEAESTEHVNASINTAYSKVDATQVMNFASSGESVGGHDGKEEGDEHMIVRSVPDAIPVVENAEAMIKGFKDHEGGKFPQFVNVDSFEPSNDVKDSVTEHNPLLFHASHLDDGSELSASAMHVLKDDLQQKDRSSKLVVNESPVEGEADVSQINIIINENRRSEELGALKDAVTIEKEKSHSVLSPEEDEAHDYCKDSSLASSLENATKAISDMNPMLSPMDDQVGKATNSFSKGEANDNEKARFEGCDIAGNDERGRTTEESCAEKIVATSEPASILSEHEVNARTNLCREENDADHEEDKKERFVESGIEAGQGDSVLVLVDESPSGRTETTPESASNIHVTSMNANNMTEGKLPRPECTSLDRVSDTQESVKGLEDDANNKGSLQCAAFSTVAKSDNDGDIQVLVKSSEDRMIKEPLISPLDISSSVKNPAIEDIHDKDFLGVTSGNKSEYLPNEGENNFVVNQLGASANDFSVDSSSLTDSLEGHWGSVSVLSTLSDIPAIVDTEHLPSNGSQPLAEAEKASLKKPLTVPETQYSDKSYVFEPPSFMTLVEPRHGGDQKAGSEIQMAQNLQQPKAGWFPSITRATSESQGRKKNEEIIAKVTNWSAGKQQNRLKSRYVPLKSLLVEATAEAKSKSPNGKESSIPAVQKDEMTAKDNDVLTAQVSSTLGPRSPMPVKKEEGKEWNSPARYPADIKREKKKVKGRPNWAQFVCCSSMN